MLRYDHNTDLGRAFAEQWNQRLRSVRIASFIVSILMLIYALVSAATGRAVSGWTSLLVSIWLVGGLVMLSLGVVGEYVGHIYLETKRRPLYIIEKRLP